MFLARSDPGGSVPGWLVNQIASDIPMTVERLNIALQRTADLSLFDKPLPDVLLFGPRDDTANGPNEQNLIPNPADNVMGNGVSDSSAFRYPELSDAQKQRFEQVLRENDGDFFASKEYLDLIPDDAQWVRRVPVVVNGTVEQHERLLARFAIPDAQFPYKQDVQSALELFHEWRSWKNGEEWTFKAQKEEYVQICVPRENLCSELYVVFCSLKIWGRSVPNEAVDIVKGEAVVPYPTSIVAGVLLNTEHRKKWDAKLDTVQRVEKTSEFTSIIYISVKTPTFITYRDMVAIAFVYPFPEYVLCFCV